MASLLVLAPLTLAATTTSALARVSIFSGYQDLGVALQCDCQSIRLLLQHCSATSYISSCVSRGCSKVENWSVDLTSMLDLYNSYCATANGQAANALDAPATLTSERTSLKTTASNGAGASSNGQATQTSRLGSSSTSSAEAQQPSAAAESGGLSRSDIVALAASLGVGIPSLLIAGLTLHFRSRISAEMLSVRAILQRSAASRIIICPMDTRTGAYCLRYLDQLIPKPGISHNE
ncbi:hypothetical protein RB213_000357 [Colletotrichum asianum]